MRGFGKSARPCDVLGLWKVDAHWMSTVGAACFGPPSAMLYDTQNAV